MSKRVKLILALGSNTDQENNFSRVIPLLRDLFGARLFFTDSIWTDPIGIDSDKYLNCLAVTSVTHGRLQIERALKNIEKKMGTTKGTKGNGIINMDIDILQYGDEKCHLDDWNRPYIIKLMKELPL
nr:2-amino-4-hydroxy-6-hydroxymethyldihydropteridine diphosphokinase [Prevotella sp.]